MKIDSQSHLSYCTNIHPGESLAEIKENISRYVLPIKENFSANAPFGLGLRLSHRCCQDLLQGDNLAQFKDFCAKNNLYHFTFNGFIYGQFHKTRVKENVYLPDWKEQQRLEFSNDLAYILAQLLPQEEDFGSISTVPCGFKNRFNNQEDIQKAANILLQHVAKLFCIYKDTNKHIALALEPEPGCLLETIEEVVEFFNRYLFCKPAIKKLQEFMGTDMAFCEKFLQQHLGICYDTCHMAIEYEEPEQAIKRLQKNNIQIFKTQISSALKLCFSSEDPTIPKWLAPFNEKVYLHQVVEKRQGKVTRFNDLPLALASLKTLAAKTLLEWRIHFHVPIFLEKADKIATTQDHILGFLKHLPQCHHFEVETYTWDVLPPKLRELELTDAIVKELTWACKQMK